MNMSNYVNVDIEKSPEKGGNVEKWEENIG